MLFICCAAILVSTESVRSALEHSFAHIVQILVDNMTFFVIGGLLLTFFCALSSLMSPGTNQYIEPTTVSKNSVEDNVKKTTKVKETPQWELFRVSNYLFSAIFVASLSVLLSISNKPNKMERVQQNPWIVYSAAMGCFLSLTYLFAFFAVGLASNQVQDSEEEEVETVGKNQFIANCKSTAQPLKQTVPLCQPQITKPSSQSSKAVPCNETEKNVFSESDEDILTQLLTTNPATKRPYMALHELEKKVGNSDFERAVKLRREYFHRQSGLDFSNVPMQDYDYGSIYGSNCEIVVGYVPLPVGLAGPLLVNNNLVYLPMATTEGCLIASTNRGCKVLNSGTGVSSIVIKDAITRAPCVRFERASETSLLKAYLDDVNNFQVLSDAFNQTTKYGKLTSIQSIQSGRNLYIRLNCYSGDAMGMNMVSKGTIEVLNHLTSKFERMEIIALSGNVCTDKKNAAINWIEGRGKSVVADAVIPKEVVQKVLKTSVDMLVDLNLQKNLIGSCMAGSIGGFNAHAANIVTAIFLATGQDPAQNVESSNCITMLEKNKDGDLYMSVTMPSLEVGVLGGGTHLCAQKACLNLIQSNNSNTSTSTKINAKDLACAIAGGVMAGELSLMAALATNELVKSHLELNRRTVTSA